MRIVKKVFIAVFFCLLLIPVSQLNRDKNAVSAIDNRALAQNPFEQKGNNLDTALESYLSDRIGFRNEAILAYTILNDRLFHVMVHPTYEYGRDGYVFFRRQTGKSEFYYSDFYAVFADTIATMRDYCEARGVPFIFMFEPLKNSIYADKIPLGINYDDRWVSEFMSLLDDRHINYVDNTKTMIRCRKNGEEVYNRVFDAGHWNDLGAFYGVNEVLEAMHKINSTICANSKDEYNISRELNESLLVSEFPIHEYAPKFLPKKALKNITSEYNSEIELHRQYPAFAYYVNDNKKQAPRVMVFQGSNLNYRYQFFGSSFREYIMIHDYENALNLDYYFNLFQPDYVVFEVAQNACNSGYFDYNKQKAGLDLPRRLACYKEFKQENISGKDIKADIHIGKSIAKITLSNVPANTRYAFIEMNGKEYNMHRQEKGSFSLSVKSNNLFEDQKDVTITFVNVEHKTNSIVSTSLNQMLK